MFTLDCNAFCSRRTLSQPRHRLVRSKRNSEEDISKIEQEVLATTQAKLDLRRLVQAIDDDSPSAAIESAVDSTGNNGAPLVLDQWKIAFAGGLAAFLLSFLLFHNLLASAASLVVVFVAGLGDPLEEESVFGPLARVLGRTTLRSVQASEPKVRAVARAVVTDEEEVVALKQRILNLEDENEQLRSWKRIRIAVDESLSKFALEDLKDAARSNGIAVGGTKSQLLMRLVKAGVITI